MQLVRKCLFETNPCSLSATSMESLSATSPTLSYLQLVQDYLSFATSSKSLSATSSPYSMP